MKKNNFLALLISFTISPLAFSNQLTQDEVNQLITRRELVKTWASTCTNGSYSEKLSYCKQHDMNLFAGLGCLAATLSGDTETQTSRCNDVKNAQGSNGRWWRGPNRVNDNKDNAFSRDMARGSHAYFIAKAYLNKNQREKEEVSLSALKWLEWISSDEADQKLCTVFTKNRCRITIGAKNLFYNVFDSIGILNIASSKSSSLSLRKMTKKIQRSKWYLKNLFLFETKLTEKGYPRHLKASSILMYRILNYKESRFKSKKVRKVLNKSAKWLYKRNKENALLNFLHKGNSSQLVKEIMFRCPTTLPYPEKDQRDFQWQRTNSEHFFANTDGHDCIYLINLMLAKNQGKLPW